MNKKILYIGNDLAKKSNYNSTMETLSVLLAKEGFKVYRTSNKLNKILRLLEMCFSVFKYKFKVDYILIDTFSTTNFYYAFCTSQIARLLRINYIPILHGGNLPNRLKRSPILSKLIFNYSYKNIAPSNYLKSEFEKSGFNVDFIPNILEINNYNFKERKKLKPKILWVRAFKNMYNPKMAILVLNEVVKIYKNASLCMVGPIIDETYDETIKLIQQLNLENKVKITGVMPKEKWHKLSSDYDIFINTTNFDNTPVSVMEAMALGLPIVTTNAGGIPFLVSDQVDGMLIKKNDIISMAKEVVNLIDGNNSHLSINARRKVETFDWSYVKSKWINLLK